MSKYYDLDKLKDMIEAKAETLLGDGAIAFHAVGKWLDFLPAADAEPIVHAHWQDKETQIGIPKYHYIVCPKCSSGYNIVYVHLLLGDGKSFNRCPECGAKMDEGVKQDEEIH